MTTYHGLFRRMQGIIVALILLFTAGWGADGANASRRVVAVEPSVLTGTTTTFGLQPLERMTLSDNLSISFSTADGKSIPSFYSSNSTVRVYLGNTFTLERTGGAKVESVEFQAVDSGKEPAELTVDNGEYTLDQERLVYTWFNSANADVTTFTIAYTQMRFTEVTVTFADGESDRPTAPSISVGSRIFTSQFSVGLSATSDDTDHIRYTLDGSDPDATNGTVYTDSIMIPRGADVRLKAVAVAADGSISDVAAATYTYLHKFALNVRSTNKNGISYIYYSSNSDYGSFSGDKTLDISPGETLNFDLSLNSGYKLRSVTLDGDPISVNNRYFEFTMPEADATLLIDVEFDPASPSEPQQPSTVKSYKLTLVNNPAGAATLYGAGSIRAGSTASVSVSSNSGYIFTGWTMNGTTVSTSSSYSFTMPESDVVLTANFRYNPSSPSEPQKPTLQRPLTVIASPSGAATFSTSGQTVAEGQTYTVYAYPRTGYRFKGWIINGVAQETTSTTLRATMTEEGAQVVGLFVYQPESPSNPGANFFNPATGQMIIDDFTPGNLYDAIGSLIGYDGFDNVNSLTVKGQISSSDYGVVSNFSNLVAADFSRVGGAVNPGSYAFSGSSVSSLVLPASTSSVGNYAFSYCQNLTSLTLFAMEPPACTSRTFQDFNNKKFCTLYVPEEAIELYLAADYWKDFDIMPITDDVHVLQVNLPESAADGRYRNNSIEIVNANSGVRQKYVVSDRMLYTFSNLRKDEQYNIYIMSQSGLEIGCIENVTIPDSDIEVTFEELRPLMEVAASVTASGSDADLTSKTTIEWFKPLADGSAVYLRKSASLGEVPEGEQLICRISLDSELAAAYASPADTAVTAAGDGHIGIMLTPLREIRLSGHVLGSDSLDLKDAVVTLSQTFGPATVKNITARTDRRGRWSATVRDAASTRLTYSAAEHINHADTLGRFESPETEIDLGTIAMRPLSGTRVTYGFSHTAAGASEPSDYYLDHKDVAIDVYNITRQCRIENVALQYPVAVIFGESVSEGDKLRLTASSISGSFNPVAATAEIDDNLTGTVTFPIVDKGAIKASYQSSDNPSVAAMLYGNDGELKAKSIYLNSETGFSFLDDGDYTLVTMGSAEILNSVKRLDNFAEIGLTEGTDYIASSVSVVSGKIAEVNLEEIPAFDESLYTYTGNATGFSANKSSISSGNYLTLRSKIDFKPVYGSSVSDVNLIVDLPSGCSLVEGSVISGTTLLPYTLDNRRLTIPLGNSYSAETRFCIIPTEGGTFSATASLLFDLSGRKVTQPIGVAVSEVKDIEFNIPPLTATPKFRANGTSQARASIDIFEDGTLIGSGTANSSGLWNVECELPDPVSLQQHSIQARITTLDGVIMNTSPRTITYDRNTVTVSKVTMYHGSEKSEFDFLNPKIVPSKWTLIPYSKLFTYTVEFTDNNPERVGNVILYVHTHDGQYIPCVTAFDEDKELWVTSIDMGSANNGFYPENCSVDFDLLENPVGDSEDASAILSEIDTVKSEDESVGQIATQIGSADSFDSELFDRLFELLGIDSSEPQSIPSDLEAFFSEATDLDAPDTSGFEIGENGVISFIDDNGNRVELISRITRDASVPEEDLADYEAVAMSDGSTLWIGTSEEISTVYYDNTLIEFGVRNDAAHQSPSRVPEAVDEFFTKWNQLQTTIDIMENVPHTREIVERVSAFLRSPLTKMEYELRACRDIEWAMAYDQIPPEELAKIDMQKLKRLQKELPGKIRAYKEALKRLSTLCKGINVAAIIMDIKTAWDSRTEWNEIIKSIENNDCPGMDALAAKARSYRDWVARGYTTNISANVACLAGLDKALGKLAAATAGVSAEAALGVQMISMVSLIFIDFQVIQGGLNQINDINWKGEIRNKIPVLKCPEGCGEPGNPPCPETKPSQGGGFGGGFGNGNGNGNGTPGGLKSHRKGGKHPSGSVNDGVAIDPSGFVYEAVPDNRVEGVQATIYYKETTYDMYGDPHEETVLWDAAEYAQQNPLFTDEQGLYQWDVPQGLWQVKFEKDGYLTTYSEWLPVPPPQLEVNIGIVQNKQPEVTEARAYEEGVEVQFDKYMNLSTLTTDNIHVSANGEKLDGEIIMVDSALADENASEDDSDATRYASRIRFVPARKLSATTGEIRLTVSRNVLSYAGIPMTETYSQVLDVEKEVQEIVADDIKVLYGGSRSLTVFALPYEAAVGRTLRIANSTDIIASLDTASVVFDDEGKAVVNIKGDLPGRTQLSFTIDNVTARGECAVDVVTELITAEAPKASRATGTALYRGTKVELTTESKDATIFFTTDGSSPDDENGTRRKYTVPVVVDAPTRILAITKVGNGKDDISEIAEFNYTLRRSDFDFRMEQGWTWMSHNLETPVNAADLAAESSVARIMTQTREAIRDPQFGIVGTLNEVAASESFKVETSAPTSAVRCSDYAWNPATPILLSQGWNWLGYPVDQTMTLDEAFAPTAVETLDVVVGQNGFAQFDGEKWVGTLATLSPGAGYMYQSASAKKVVYNTSIVSTAAAKNVAGISDKLPLAIDIHRYASVMPVAATLRDAVSETPLDCADYIVTAFCGSECRGVGRVHDNNLVMMSVYGNAGDEITLQVTDAEGEKMFAVTNSGLRFSEDMLGDIFSPYPVSVNTRSSIPATAYEGNVGVTVDGDMLRITGIDTNNIDRVDIFNTDGQLLMRTSEVSEAGIRLTLSGGGVYIVVVSAEGSFTYHKIALR